MPRRDITWWFWLATDIALANTLLVDRVFLKAAVALAAIQIPVFIRRGGGPFAFPAQVRFSYLGLLIIGMWPPFGLVHWVQLVGTTAMVLFGYCFLARCLSLLPWNRSRPLTARLFAATFLTPPVEGSFPAHRQRVGFGGISSGNA